MPSYTWLRPQEGDDSQTLTTKQRAVAKLKALRQALETHIDDAVLPGEVETPPDSSTFVRIATWNIQDFDSRSYGFRSQESLAYIAEIISHFDLVAVQEVKRDLGPLKRLRRLLGPSWDYITTDITEGSAGNRERMAFLFNRNRVTFAHVTGELTLPHGQKVTDPFGDRFRVEGGAQLELPAGEVITSPTGLRTDTLASGQTKIEEEVEIALPEGTKVVLPQGATIRFADNARVPITADDAIEIEQSSTPTLPEAAEIVLPPNSVVGGPQQFARTPFVACFQAGWLKINLAIVHIYFGSGATGLERRKDEIRRLTKLLADRAKSDSDSDADAYFIALGDFNIKHPEHDTMEALLTNDFVIPEPLQALPGSNVNQDRFYDQIALWDGESSRRKTYTRIIPYRAGVFDFYDTVYTEDEEDIYHPFMKKPDSDEFYASYRAWRTRQMSDHLPMWVELRVDFTDAYLDEVASDLEAEIES